MKAEIDRRVELVQVLLYLAEEQELTIQYLANKTYLRNISDWFSPYKEHAAVKLTKRMVLEENFFHIRPLKAILDLEGILDDGFHKLHLWALEVVAFARESAFDEFFDTQSEFYAEILAYVSSCEFDTWISYIENYFRGKPEEFHLIICPIAGNYGFTRMQGEKKIAYTLRFAPKYDENGRPDGKFDYFAMGIAHEYAHCFVNPVVEGKRELLKGHARFFEQHNNMPQSYNVDYAVINEYLARAFSIRFMEEHRRLFPEFDLSAEYERQRSMFPFIDDFVGLLREFEKGRVAFREYYENNIERVLRGKDP